MVDAEYIRAQRRVALGCFFGVLLASGFTASFSIFLLPVSEAFGWGRSVMSSAFFVAQLVAAACYPLFGMFIDKFGARLALAPALVIHGLSIMALGLLNGSMVQLYILYIFLGIGVALTGYIAYVKLISAWFKERRGTMIGLSLGAGIAIGGTIAPQVATYLIDAVGWRQAYFWLGLPFFILALPNLLLLNEPGDAKPSGAQSAETQGMELGGAIRTPTFWLLFLAILCISVGWEGPKGHMVALLTDRGETKEFAATVLSVVGLCGALGRITGGFLLDRFQTPRIAVAVFSVVLLGVIVLDLASGYWLFLGAVILGLGVGAELDILAYFVSRYFGMRNYSQLYGAIAACAIMSYGLGPMILGVAYDNLGDYDLAIFAMQGLIVASILLVLLLGPYKYDVRNRRVAVAEGEELRNLRPGRQAL